MIKDLSLKDRIVEASQELFFKFGIRSITMDEIATKLGMSKKTIYHYFANKDEIIQFVAEQHLQHEKEVLAQLLARNLNPLEEFFYLIFYLSRSDEKMNPCVPMEIRKHYPQIFELFREFKTNFISDTLKDNIRRGIALGLYRKDLEPDILIAIHNEVASTLANSSLMEKYDIRDLHAQYILHFLHGLCSLKGQELLEDYKQHASLIKS